MSYEKLNKLQPNSTELALFWASQGYKVFPVGKDKKPNNGFKWKEHATTDPTMISAYWDGAHKGSGVGIRTGKESNLLVLDIDNKNGVNGSDSLEALEKQFGSLPNTFTVKTPSGGYHYLLTYEDCGLTIGAGIYEGIDYRGENGFVVASGSITQGGQYEIVNDAPIASMPDWLPKALQGNNDVQSDTDQTTPNSNFMSTGSRNTSLTSIAGSMRRKGMEQEEMEEYLLAMNSALPEPLPKSEVISITKSIAQYDPSDTSVYTNEQDFSENVAREWNEKVRYTSSLGFLINDSDIWVRDGESLRVKRLLQDVVSKACLDLEKIASSQKDKSEADRTLKLRKKLKTRSFQQNCLELIKSHPLILTFAIDLDQYSQYVGTKEGVLDIDERKIVDNGSSCLVTKRFETIYDPHAECPNFDRFMIQIFPDPETRSYVLKTLGYALSGEASLRSLFIWVGSGANGKSTLLEILCYIMGCYSVTLDPQSLTKKMNSGISNDIAQLRGTRLCATSETSVGAVLDISLLKRLSGNDTISARYLHQEFFEFQNNAVIFMASNFVPVFDGSCGAFSDRVNIVPFGQVIPKEDRDPKLQSKLKVESSGILNRLLDAYDLYKQEGLEAPKEVLDKTELFCSQSNLIRQFIDDCIDVEAEEIVSVSMLYHRYSEWASSLGYKPLSANVFATCFEAETSLSRKRLSAGNFWEGLKFKVVVPNTPMGI